MIQHINSLGEELRRIRKWKNLKLREVLHNLDTRYGVTGSLYSTVDSLSRIERGTRRDLEKENLLQLLIGGYGLLDESEINRLLALIGYGPIDNQERARHELARPQSSTVDFARSTQQDTDNPTRADNSKLANRTFVLSVDDAIILNSVGELIFGFVSERDIAECHSSYERSLEDFAFSLVYGAELRAKWERRDPRFAPKAKPAEPAEFLIWSSSGAPYCVEKFRPKFHVDRLFENQSDRDTILDYIHYMGICMRRHRFVEWCRDWLRRESVIYLGDDKSLFKPAKEPHDVVFGKKYDIDETLLREIPKTLGENELATLVGFVPQGPSEGADRADGDRYTEQARVRFVLENVLTQITTMYQFEKHVASTRAWRVPYGLRAELTKEFGKGHQQRRLWQILLSHALDYALRLCGVKTMIERTAKPSGSSRRFAVQGA